ncbi:DUF4955 domain-containing protein [Carboxylicivirga sp. M1479]|uniref:DUF4955 domain-containing protein n=1 Tax=Carboxylicivirga sp. M1479 TaxID=2594476 RepID=UPI001178A54D|nr:DUF4955 domain-containing protein [Carboxylicivirga sp. M1479]TRX71889.1 DUF4955 domain-containing protein [Carboxylicivirga sp. M1479]
MKNIKKYLLAAGVLALTSVVNGQESALWNEFKAAQTSNKVAELPDFSYAGYHHGEKGIPDVTHQVFNVSDYGAVPNDGKSDKEAIRKTVAAAVKNGSGIVFFPKGRFLVNEDDDDQKPIVIKGNNIVFKGSGSGPDGTELYMKNYLPAKDPKKLWTCPYMFQFTGGGAEKVLAEVTQSAHRGSFELKVNDASKIKAGDWVVVRVKNNAPDLIEHEMCGCHVDKAWTSLLNKGVYVNEYHQVKSVKGKKLVLKEPLMRHVNAKHEWNILSYAHYEEVGVEDLAFIGNWQDDFVHHKDYIHDGGYSLLKFSRLANSWIRNCRFDDVNRVVSVSLSSNVSVLNCLVTGTPGHNSVSSSSSTRVLVGILDDQSSQWHAPGVSGASIGSVFWRVKYNEDTSFETHASQPRASLFDCVEGGFFLGRGGGARHNLPNHLEHLILWNYKELGEPETDFEFWSSKTWFWKIIPPIVVGFHGAGTTFKEDQIKVLESLGTPVNPESLYEAQLELRLGKLPQWLIDIKK